MDMEKVIKGLECCSNSQKNRCEANSCPYWVSECCCIDDMLNDALVLLKEQEAEIRQLRLALDIAKGTCKGIKAGGGQFADMPTLRRQT